MSRTLAISTEAQNLRNQFHADNFTPMRENHPTRRGILKSLSPRKSVQLWCDTVTRKGDLWVSDVLITESVRAEILKVADIYDSPFKKSEKKIVLYDDTHINRVRLFKTICKMCGIE